MKLACLAGELIRQRVCGQCIIGHTEKGIIPGVWLGSSAANSSSFASVVQVGEVKGDRCTQQLPSAAIHFSAPAKQGRWSQIKSLCLSQYWRGQFDFNDICFVPATRAPLPSKP